MGNANDGTGAKNRNGPARPRTTGQPIEFESRSTRRWQTIPNAGARSARCSDPRDITIRKEKARYSGQERERDGKREREKDRYTHTHTYIHAVGALHFLPSCNFYDPRKTAIFTGSALHRFDLSLPVFFPAFLHSLPIFLFSLVDMFFFPSRTSCYRRFVNSCCFFHRRKQRFIVGLFL